GVEVAIDDEATAATKESTSVLILSKGSISRKVGIDVPGVKDWDRSGGVASFYSARRLQKLLEAVPSLRLSSKTLVRILRIFALQKQQQLHSSRRLQRVVFQLQPLICSLAYLRESYD
ncbi:MAG: hypothetical protein ACXAAR_02960, partial [Candidatus Thorarchaeota archaeon]